MSYSAPLFAEASKMIITKLQRPQNKLRRHIANVERYVRIRRHHGRGVLRRVYRKR